MVEGGQPKMGSTVTRGEVEGTVEARPRRLGPAQAGLSFVDLQALSPLALSYAQFTGANTFFGKTASMIQSVEGMSHLQKARARAIDGPCRIQRANNK